MKKLLLLFVLLLTYQLQAQEPETDVEVDVPADSYGRTTEVRLNALFTILGALEVGVEQALNEESGLGVHAMLAIDDDVKEAVKWYVAPYYRMYFGHNYAQGFFIEGFGMLNKVEANIFDNIFVDDSDEYVTDFALGIGGGGKWVTKKGFVGEIGFGIGRNLFNTDQQDIEIVSRLAISIGYRF